MVYVSNGLLPITMDVPAISEVYMINQASTIFQAHRASIAHITTTSKPKELVTATCEVPDVVPPLPLPPLLVGAGAPEISLEGPAVA